jgi:hypothetical protein
MHNEILNPDQVKLLTFLALFKREFFLVGGTAIALYIGHRRSVDFDLFKYQPIKPKSIVEKISLSGYQYVVTRRVTEQLNVNINNVKFTFFQYPFKIEANQVFEGYSRIPALIDLAAMKAYALGQRSKWKDYVDIYFLIKDFFTIEQISLRATEIFGQLFSKKLFRVQLTYFDDIDYSEPVEFLCPEVPENEIKEFLINKAIDIFN